jgi:HlyD family secretion protein
MSAWEERATVPHLADPPQSDGENRLSERVRSLQLPPQIAEGHSFGHRLAWILCLLLACSTGWLAYLHFYAPTIAAPPVTAKSRTPLKTAPGPAVTASSGNVVLEAKGYVIPAHQILVSPKVSGMVVKLWIIESQRVRKGDVLAELEDTEYRAERDRAKAFLESARHNLEELERGLRPEEIAQARAELAEAEAQLMQLEADYRRSKDLFVKRVHSQEQYDEALSKYHAMEQRVQRLKQALKLAEEGPRIERINIARAQVRQAEAELTKAQWRLDNCVIRAPISGTILKKNAEEGSLVNPIAMQGFYSLCEMADLSDLEVELMIQERDISRIFQKQRCKVKAEAYPDRTYEGVVSRQMPTADRAKGAVPVRVKVKVSADEEGVYLRPDMGAIVSFFRK